MNGISLLGLPVNWLLSLTLLVVIFTDLRYMRIPNPLLLVIAGLFAASVPFAVPTSDLMWRVSAALFVLVLCFAAFAMRRLGGGDAKLLPLLVMFVAPGGWALFALFLSAGLIIGLMAVRLLRRLPAPVIDGWTGLTTTDRLPLGPSIGLAGIGYCLLGESVARWF